MFSGDSKTLQVTVRDENAAVVDLSGATIQWKLAKTAGSDNPQVSKSTTSGITVTDAANGVFQVSVDATDTADLSGTYYHEAEVIDASSNKTTVMAGYVDIRTDLIT